MLLLAIIVTCLSVGLTGLVYLGNLFGQGDNPSAPFAGGWLLAVCWVATLLLWVAWKVQ